MNPHDNPMNAAKPDAQNLHREYLERIHAAAVASGADSYVDPDTGYTVMTELFLKKRGYCCRSGCRHCPYGFSADL